MSVSLSTGRRSLRRWSMHTSVRLALHTSAAMALAYVGGEYALSTLRVGLRYIHPATAPDCAGNPAAPRSHACGIGEAAGSRRSRSHGRQRSQTSRAPAYTSANSTKSTPPGGAAVRRVPLLYTPLCPSCRLLPNNTAECA